MACYSVELRRHCSDNGTSSIRKPRLRLLERWTILGYDFCTGLATGLLILVKVDYIEVTNPAASEQSRLDW